ncbi:unnamed protein product, partial [Allacma fusca]
VVGQNRSLGNLVIDLTFTLAYGTFCLFQVNALWSRDAVVNLTNHLFDLDKFCQEKFRGIAKPRRTDGCDYVIFMFNLTMIPAAFLFSFLFLQDPSNSRYFPSLLSETLRTCSSSYWMKYLYNARNSHQRECLKATFHRNAEKNVEEDLKLYRTFWLLNVEYNDLVVIVFEVFTYPRLGSLDTWPKYLLMSLKVNARNDTRKLLQVLRPLAINIGNFYKIKRTTVLTMIVIICNFTVTIILMFG